MLNSSETHFKICNANGAIVLILEKIIKFVKHFTNLKVLDDIIILNVNLINTICVLASYLA